jgi:hypothetical protein
VAGFDDISMASMTAPSLSTVRLPLRELGRLGFAFADRVLAGEEGMPALMPTEVVLRDSTAAPPAAPIHLPFDLEAAHDRVADRGPVAAATDVTTPVANLGASS